MNTTLALIASHRSIRQFTDQPLTDEELQTLLKAASATSTSNFMQSVSIIGITDPEKKQALAEIGEQPYIATAGYLFVMVLDLRRNQRIAAEHGVASDTQTTADRFLVGAADTYLAAQNMMLAAESMGLGGVFLGSLLNDAHAVIDLLNLPEYTFPLLGIAVGHPAQSPQLKPRLPLDVIFMENTYTEPSSYQEALADYDQIVQTYYDLRQQNRRVDAFTTQAAQFVQKQRESRREVLSALHRQKLLLI